MLGIPKGGTGRRILLVFSFILAAAWGQMNFTGDQVLRVLAKDEEQLSLLRDLEGLKPQKVDFWRGPARPSLPVDMRIPFSELNDIKAYLESHGLAYSVMIKDIQASGPSLSLPAAPFCRALLTVYLWNWIHRFVSSHVALH